MRKQIVCVLGLVLLLLSLNCNRAALAADLGNGAQIFEVHCAGCHPNGENIIRRGKSLKLKALKRHKVDSIENVTDLVTNGKGIMSAFGSRLTPEEIQDVAAYVLDRAADNWQASK
jgi:cytochrome c6